MDNFFLVGCGKTISALDGDVQKSRHVRPLLRGNAQRSAFNVFHYQQKLVGTFNYVINTGNVGMVERGSSLRFFQQPLAVAIIFLQPRRIRLMATTRCRVVSSAR